MIQEKSLGQTKEESTLSKELKAFLRKHVHSVEELEILLLIHSKPEKVWSAPEISHELRINPISVLSRLIAFHQSGLLLHEAGAGKLYEYLYNQANGERLLIDELAQVFPALQMRILDLIFSQYRDDLMNLANAFRFKKENKDG